MEFAQEQRLYAEIVQKAWDDAQFKKELSANPVAAIEKLTGQKLNLTQGKMLVVRDQTDEETVYINLSAKHNREDVELNEDQLEAVAGGAKLPGGGGFLNPIIVGPITDIPVHSGPILPTFPNIPNETY